MTKKTKNRLAFLAASLAVATGLFWAKILISPPVTMAAPNQGIDAAQIARNASKNIPSFDDLYQRHTGVLDVLRVP